jgi:hypothetical protein
MAKTFLRSILQSAYRNGCYLNCKQTSVAAVHGDTIQPHCDPIMRPGGRVLAKIKCVSSTGDRTLDHPERGYTVYAMLAPVAIWCQLLNGVKT